MQKQPCVPESLCAQTHTHTLFHSHSKFPTKPKHRNAEPEERHCKQNVFDTFCLSNCRKELAKMNYGCLRDNRVDLISRCVVHCEWFDLTETVNAYCVHRHIGTASKGNRSIEFRGNQMITGLLLRSTTMWKCVVGCLSITYYYLFLLWLLLLAAMCCVVMCPLVPFISKRTLVRDKL